MRMSTLPPMTTGNVVPRPTVVIAKASSPASSLTRSEPPIWKADSCTASSPSLPRTTTFRTPTNVFAVGVFGATTSSPGNPLPSTRSKPPAGSHLIFKVPPDCFTSTFASAELASASVIASARSGSVFVRSIGVPVGWG